MEEKTDENTNGCQAIPDNTADLARQTHAPAATTQDPKMPQPDNTKMRSIAEIRGLSWNEYFMGFAIMAAYRSKDEDYQVGACIVNSEKRVLATGYNGLPDGHRKDALHSGNDEFDRMSLEKNKKHHYVCHAELNAIANAREDLLDSTLYVTRFPCTECTKLIVQSRIGKVYYLDSDKAHKHKDPKSGLTEFEASQNIFSYVVRNLVASKKQTNGFKYAEFLPEWSNSKYVHGLYEKLMRKP